MDTDWETVNRAAVTNKKQRLRALKFQPERFIDPENETAANATSEKQKWIADTSTNRLTRHQKITTANQKLQLYVQSERNAIESELEQIKSQLRTSQVLGSREYSFCLHSQELIAALRRPLM